jgi:chorismate dehydratase
VNPPDQPKSSSFRPTEPPESVEHIATTLQSEQTKRDMHREDELSGSLAPFRVGSVPYLNAVPLTRGIEDQIELHTPAELAELLREGKLDAGLVSLTEVLFNDCYDVLDGIAIASLGEVFSVIFAYRKPLDQLKEIWVDAASCTSVNLLRVLLAERGLAPELKPLPDYELAPLLDGVLLIGDRAIEFQRAQHNHMILDLGTAWHDLTGLPFVYAVWALRRDKDTRVLRGRLRQAKSFGLDTLEHLINTRPEFDREFRQDYLGWHVHYHLTGDEKRGVAKFAELLRKHGDQPVYDPHYVT